MKGSGKKQKTDAPPRASEGVRNMEGSLALHRRLVEEGCIECGLCQKDCLFLQRYGTPKKIAAQPLSSADELQFSFACSLCGLCTAVCPKQIDPAAMFAVMRVAAQEESGGRSGRHASSLLRYESLGASAGFSWLGLPAACDTVFFPGCALAGSRAGRVLETYAHLRRAIPNLGLVLDCCTKPSHDLGRRGYFHRLFGALRQALAEKGVRTVLVACPSCFRVWRDYGGAIAVRSVYEELAAAPPARRVKPTTILTVHDPCPIRNEPAVHAAVRSLLAAMGGTVREMKHHGRKTLCCGEGGAACYLAPELGGNWTRLRAREAEGRQIITYCAGCTNFLGRLTPAHHLLDLFFDPEGTLAGRVKVARSPLTWLARALLRLRASRLVRPAMIGRRTRDGRITWRVQERCRSKAASGG